MDKGYFLPSWKMGEGIFIPSPLLSPYLFERSGAVNREEWMSTILLLGKFHSFAL